MATITMQRDFVVNFKKETFENVRLLSKLQPMPADLSGQVFKDNALEKPTQSFFNQLSYYLVCTVDAKAAGGFSWPLYDTKTEKAYRNELSAFINNYSSKGLLFPVMSSYLVNPSCFKVTMLMFQLSQLGVQRILLAKMKTNRQRELYDDMTEKYKQHKEGFMEIIESATVLILSKFANFVHKKNVKEEIKEMLCKKIKDIETKLESLKCQKYIHDLVDKYLETHNVDDALKDEILKIKNVNITSKFFDEWLSYVDKEIDSLESEWENNVAPFLEKAKQTRECTKALIDRHTGEADEGSYTIEYNPNTDNICTKDLQDQVNSHQKYILCNIVKDNKLNFPNLIRAFLVSISFMLKSAEIGDEIFKFNVYLDRGWRNYKEIVSAMRILVKRVLNAEARLEPSPPLINKLLSMKELAEIPPPPNLSELKANRDCEILFDNFTPFSVSKQQFNLHRKSHMHSLKSQPKSLLLETFQPLQDDFLKGLISCRVSSYDHSNTSIIHDMSTICHFTHENNETLAECTSGFTKQQILRLLSTKKSSSSKKFKFITERPNINVKKGGLFNVSNISNKSCGLYRSHSSPNLFENREKRFVNRLQKRKLSIMRENSLSEFEVSGISHLEIGNSYRIPDNNNTFKNINEQDTTSLPMITLTKDGEAGKTIIRCNPIEENFKDVSPVLKDDRHYADPQNDLKQSKDLHEDAKKSIDKEDSKSETPKTNMQLIKKTSSLEKIINRFKKVRASVVSDMSRDDTEFKTIAEEKENFNSVNVDVFTANKVLLPDLLSPSCSVQSMKTSYLDQMCFDMDEKAKRKPRESLGTALGVDKTFLDQFDLID